MDGQSRTHEEARATRQRAGKRQRTPRRGVSGGRARTRNRQIVGRDDQPLLREPNPAATPLVVPPAAGLSLPSLAGIPPLYAVHTDVREGARLTLALLVAEVVDADDYREGDDPASYIGRSITRLWTPELLTSFGYSYTFDTVDDQLYFLIKLGGSHYLDFTPVTFVCDAVHKQLGPSLLTHLYRHTPLTPAFTPEVCREFITMLYWEGFDDAECLLEQARYEVAQNQNIDPGSVSAEEVESYADSYYFTPKRVDSLIDKRYQNPGRLSLKTCRKLCRLHGLENLSGVCELLGRLERLSATFPLRSERIYEDSGDYGTFAAVIGVEAEDGDENLVTEIYREHEQQMWQYGELEPVYALALNLADPDSLSTLRTALEAAKESLELTQTLYDTLEETTCLSP